MRRAVRIYDRRAYRVEATHKEESGCVRCGKEGTSFVCTQCAQELQRDWR
jgi:hypothetical protein